jgi:hypothetical protein
MDISIRLYGTSSVDIRGKSTGMGRGFDAHGTFVPTNGKGGAGDETIGELDVGIGVDGKFRRMRRDAPQYGEQGREGEMPEMRSNLHGRGGEEGA